MEISALFKLGVKTAATLFYGLGLICLIGQYVWLFPLSEMLLSFLPHIVLLGLLSSIGFMWHSLRLGLAGAAFLLFAGAPYLFFSEYESPTGVACSESECLTVITANTYQSRSAQAELARLAVREAADIVAINEPALAVTEADYRQAYLAFAEVLNATSFPEVGRISIPLAMISRDPLRDWNVVVPPRTAFRSILSADLGGDWDGTRVVAAHAMVPISSPGLFARNTLLAEARRIAEDADSFILLGDFNMTPWSPKYRDLPGRRAGDPRFVATWPVNFGPFGIPIDHIMFSDDLELVEARVLDKIGSDHRPVLARFRRKPSE
ncbi:MAG: endonuclease/exonuclease/phosphatase family protein [Hyphomonadaceae bacterium]|nr:endonuclease/exonuclease/phosphatase family protein [Hyphomonadaceae bacterium]